MAIVKTYQVTYDAAGDALEARELDIAPPPRVVIVFAKNVTAALKAANNLRGNP